jgi:hypothetical protein
VYLVSKAKAFTEPSKKKLKSDVVKSFEDIFILGFLFQSMDKDSELDFKPTRLNLRDKSKSFAHEKTMPFSDQRNYPYQSIFSLKSLTSFTSLLGIFNLPLN